MPVKIETGGLVKTLRNISVGGADIEKIGVDGSPVFLNNHRGAIVTSKRSIGELLSAPFSTDYGVWYFELSLKGTELVSAGTPEFDFTISIIIDVGMGVEINARKFSINISGNNLYNATVKITSDFDIDSSQTVDLTSMTPILSLEPIKEGNDLRMSFLGGSFEYPGFKIIPNISWYNKNYPKYVVSASGNPGRLFKFDFDIGNQDIGFTH